MSLADPTEPARLFRGPPRYVAETPWGPMSALVATFFICAASLIIFFLVMAIWVAPEASGNDMRDLMRSLDGIATPLGAGLAAGSQLISLALVLIFASWGGNPARVLKLAETPASPALYVAAALLLLALTSLIEVLLYWVVEFDLVADTEIFREGLNSPVWWVTVLIAVVLAPLWEELTFRGFLLSAMARTRMGFWGAAIISNVMWTGLHASYSVPGLISVFTAGFILSWLVWRTNAIMPAIVAHGAGNLAALAFAISFAPAAPA